LKKYKKNISSFLQSKKNLFLLFFFLPLLGLSQNDRDTGLTIIEESPPDEVIQDNSYDYDDEDRQYFTYLWETEDSFIVQQRKIPDEQVRKMQEDDDFWYANTEIKKTKKDEEKQDHVPISQRKWFQALLWIVIVGGFAVFVALYLTGSNVGLFRRRAEALATGSETDEIPQDIFAINYQKEIDKAAANGNYRLAVRLMFLRLLKQMTERNIIQYKQDKTNFDYLMQLQPTSYYNNFFRVTRNYEYSWYGKFPISEEAYKAIRNDFAQFDRQFH
jgi:hypothetical protein